MESLQLYVKCVMPRYVNASSAKKVYTPYSETASNQRLLESIKQLPLLASPIKDALASTSEGLSKGCLKLKIYENKRSNGYYRSFAWNYACYGRSWIHQK